MRNYPPPPPTNTYLLPPKLLVITLTLWNLYTPRYSYDFFDVDIILVYYFLNVTFDPPPAQFVGWKKLTKLVDVEVWIYKISKFSVKNSTFRAIWRFVWNCVDLMCLVGWVYEILKVPLLLYYFFLLLLENRKEKSRFGQIVRFFGNCVAFLDQRSLRVG